MIFGFGAQNFNLLSVPYVIFLSCSCRRDLNDIWEEKLSAEGGISSPGSGATTSSFCSPHLHPVPNVSRLRVRGNRLGRRVVGCANLFRLKMQTFSMCSNHRFGR